MKDYKTSLWIRKVIDSCKTKEQLGCTLKLISLYRNSPVKSLHKELNVSELISLYKLKKADL